MKNSLDYIKTQFYSDIDNYKDKKSLITGFSEIDKNMDGFKSGLFVFGGSSGVGKTTLIHQMIEKFATTDTKIHFYSLEQTQFELITKSLSRISYINGFPLDLKDIRNGKSEKIKDTIEIYGKYGKNIIIMDGDSSMRIDIIEKNLSSSSDIENTAIVIDYLQLLELTSSNYDSDKMRVDNSMNRLKVISKKYNVPIFIISSFNRMSYNKGVDFSAFKESGSIEYTADAVFALEYNIEVQTLRKTDEEKYKLLVKEEQNKEIKKLKLTCLKNKHGNVFTQYLRFNAKYSYFQEDEQNLMNDIELF